jgi:hypothetical protein
MSIAFNLNNTIQRALDAAAQGCVREAVEFLADKHGFDCEESLAEIKSLIFDAPGLSSPSYKQQHQSEEEEDADQDGWSVLCYKDNTYGENEHDEDFKNTDLGKDMATLRYEHWVASGLYGAVELFHYVDGDGDHVDSWERDDAEEDDLKNRYINNKATKLQRWWRSFEELPPCCPCPE